MALCRRVSCVGVFGATCSICILLCTLLLFYNGPSRYDEIYMKMKLSVKQFELLTKNTRTNLTAIDDHALNKAASKVPRRIHQIWNSYNILELFVPWIHSWLNNHSDGWEYWFWTDEEANKLMESVPEVEKAYHSIENPTFKANLLKFLIIYKFGGVYVDLDMENLKPFDIWTEQHYCVVSEENLEHAFRSRGKIMMTMFVCISGHPFIKALLEGSLHYPKMPMGNKYYFADGIYLRYIRAHPNQKGRDALYVETDGDVFFPTFDPTHMNSVKALCRSNKSHPNARLRKMCEKHRTNQFANVPSNNSYTNHYWVHLNHNSKKAAAMPIIDVREVVPKDRFTNILDEINKL